MRATASRRARKGAALAAGLACWLLALSCGQILGSSDLEIGECVDGALRCTGNTPERCAQGKWSPDYACDHQTCDPGTGTCVGECGPDAKRCTGDTPQTCGADGQWQDSATLCAVGQHCSGGLCMVDCMPKDLRCVGNTPQRCNAFGQWTDSQSGPCKGKTCLSGVCMGDCALGDAKCDDQLPQACTVTGTWQEKTACSSPSSCVSGSCPGPSCAGMMPSCGPKNDESCCLSPVVWGGTYDRSNQVEYPATVSDFRLDRFEVTVGRFRAFVNGFPGNRPTEGAGAHPLIPNSGWSSTWDAKLPMNKTKLRDALNSGSNATWTDMALVNENLPINCIDWYTAFAFCAWDGGRLPTEAEWNYAAAGGAEQRAFPWSNPPSAQTIDRDHAFYSTQGPGLVGTTSPRGDGKWGQADLAGNLAEWVLDWFEMPYHSACSDCAAISDPHYPLRVHRGGSWDDNEQDLLTFSRNYNDPDMVNAWLPVRGIRCARQP